MPSQDSLNLVLCLGLKVVLVITTSLVLHLVGQEYLRSYLIVLMYVICASTLLYIVVSLIIHFATVSQCPKDIGSCALAEMILSAGGLISWVLVCGLTGNIAMRTIEETGEPFGWASGLSGINIAIFLALVGIFTGQLMRSQKYDLLKERRPAPAHL